LQNVLVFSRPPISLYLRLRVVVDITVIINELFRPPDIVVGGLRFHRDSSFCLLFYSSAVLQARWTQLNQNRPHARKWVRFENAWPKSGASTPAKSRGPKTTFYRRLCNLAANLTAFIFARIRMYLIRRVHSKLQGVSYIISKCYKLSSTNGFKLEVSFHPPYKSAFHFIARFRRRRSATELNQTLVNGVQ